MITKYISSGCTMRPITSGFLAPLLADRSRISHKISKSHGSTTKAQRTLLRASSSTASSISTDFRLASRLNGLDHPTVWQEFSPLAVKHGAVNLGQGFPDWDPPSFVVQSMLESTDSSYGRNANQYARSAAHMPLAEVLAEDYSQRLGFSIDPVTEVATSVGCTQGLYCAFQGMLEHGDEVILMEPAFDVYSCQVRLAGGKPVYVPLRTTASSDGEKSDEAPNANDMFHLDMDELEAAITPKTKILLINTPHNPTGKMFSQKEMDAIADVLRRHPHVIVVTDEVYEHIVFDEETSPHIFFASLPDMYERTLTLSSSGKTFSATGWKVGWAIGPPHLVRAITSIQQWVNFSVPTPNQDAIALSLQKAREPYQSFPNFYTYLADDYKRKRDVLTKVLQDAGMTPIVPPGGFFIMADTSNISFPASYLEEVTEAMPVTPMPRDWGMSRWMTKEVGVTAIPPSAFYAKERVHLAENLLRFAYCKGEDTILEAGKRFQAYQSR